MNIAARIPSFRHVMLMCVLLLAAVCLRPALAQDTGAEVRQIWKLLDYIAVDYPGAVANGAVISDFEYAEMKEFSATALARMSALPAQGGQPDLIKQAAQLQTTVAAMGDPVEVARIARAAADRLLAAYPVPLSPPSPPDLARGAAVYAEHCASCHGIDGKADGPAAAGLDPAPIPFADHARARERSLFSLYEVVTQGLADTSMIGYQETLPDEDRWAVAFYAGTLAHTAEQRQQGERLWREETALHSRIPTLEALTRTLESTLATDIGPEKAVAVMAYLRSQPANTLQAASGLSIARSQLAESVKAYQAGEAGRAGTLALSSYLDGFEPIEALLRTRDSQLLIDVETAMIEYRARINNGAPPADVAAQAAVLNQLFDRTDAALAPSADDATTAFLGAFTILLREGIEAMLVVIAMITFLTKVDRRDVLPYVHTGWVGALLAGVGTWAVAAYVVDISGANRELTEGFSALFAAVVLLGVGVWMHQKSMAGRWQAYIRDKLSAAMSKRSAFFLFLLAFVAVYREVFETILFYVALFTRGNGGSILAGFVAGSVVLAVIAVVLMRTSQRLPISQFFRWSSVLIAVLAVVLAGKGMAAFQEAGYVPAIPVAFPRVEALGVYPSAYPLLAQLAVAVVAIAGFLWNAHSSRKLEASAR